MTPRPLAIQLWTVRDALWSGRPGTLRRVAEAGFRAVELFGLGQTRQTVNERLADARSYRQDLDACGLVVVAAHGAVPSEGDEAVFDELAILGTERLIAASPSAIAGFDDGSFASVEDVRKFAAAMNRATSRAARHGISVGYHNHDFEWRPLRDSEPAFDMFVEELDPAVFLEIDVYWAHCAGQRPADVIARHGQRVQMLHLKDGPGVRGEPHVALGAGAVDNAGPAAAGADVAWHVVELDDCTGDPLAAARQGAEWLVQRGLSSWA